MLSLFVNVLSGDKESIIKISQNNWLIAINLYLLFINIDKFQFISFIFSVLENIFILIDTENDHGFQLIPLIIKKRDEERSISYLYVIVVC